MKSNPYARLSAFILIGAALTLAMGCQQTPKQRLTLATEAYVGVEKQINDLRDAGKITDAQRDAIRPYRDAASAALTKAKAALEAGNTSDLYQALAAAEGAIESMIASRDSAAGKTLTP